MPNLSAATPLQLIESTNHRAAKAAILRSHRDSRCHFLDTRPPVGTRQIVRIVGLGKTQSMRGTTEGGPLIVDNGHHGREPKQNDYTFTDLA
jgi:hypothetical protein